LTSDKQMSIPEEKIIEQTNNWIKSVVIDCNFCPFAARAVLKKRFAILLNQMQT
jgi:hypothetical protein